MTRLTILAAAAGLALAAAPTGAAAAADPREPAGGLEAAEEGADPERDRARSCRILRRQIAHFVDVAEMADDRDEELWERATRRHIDRLKTRQARLCPQDVPPSLSSRLGSLARGIGRAAKTAFTLGLL